MTQQQWQNANGQVVTIHACGDLTVGTQPCQCQRPQQRATNRRREDVVQALNATVQQLEQQVRRVAAARGLQLVHQEQIAGVFLTPAGELVGTLTKDTGPRQYAAPVSPWSKSEGQLSALREQIRETASWLEGNPAADWTTRTRREQDLTSLQRELASAELEGRLARRRQQLG